MHILVANNIYPPIAAGGAELIVSYLCEELVRRGHRVTVVSTCGPEMEPYPNEIRNGVEVIRFFPPNVYWSFDRSREPGIKKWLWHARDAWNREAGKRLKAIFDTACPDVMHTHLIDGMSASIWRRARRQDIPVLHTAHDYHLLCPRAFMLTGDWKLCVRPSTPCRVYRNWHLATTRYVDLFTSPSQFLLDKHIEAGLAATQGAVVANGIPQPEDIERIRRMRHPDSRNRFLMLSRLTVEKGVDVVIEAVKRLPEDSPIRVTIAGKGPLEDRVQAVAANDPRITYLGYISGDEKLKALADSSWLLLPSLWYENAPVSIVEAAAYGLGVIGSNIGAIPEFIESGRTGVLFPPGDAEALALTMTRVAEAQHALPEMEANTKALSERYTVKRMADQYEMHYRDLAMPQPILAIAV
jgi:glycosyltransferase involved in cell wall biosynthesis